MSEMVGVASGVDLPTSESLDCFYPFFDKKIGSTRVRCVSPEGSAWTTLAQALGPQIAATFRGSYFYTKRALMAKYLRICQGNQKQPQATKLGAGTRRAVHSTPVGRQMSRLPRARVGYARVVSNIPQARGGRLAQRLMKNQLKGQMNHTQKRRARAAILYHLLRKSKILLVPNQIFTRSTREFLDFFHKSRQVPRRSPAEKVVLIMRTQGSKHGSSHLSGYLLDQNHHTMYKLIPKLDRLVIASRQGLADLLTRVYL